MKLNQQLAIAIAVSAMGLSRSAWALSASYFGSTTPIFENPSWSAGPLTTSEQWDTFTSNTGAADLINGTDNFLSQPGGGLAQPNLSASGLNSDIYIFDSSPVAVTVPNYGGPTGNAITGGTYVNVQVAATIGADGDGVTTPITQLDYNILPGTLHITDASGNPLTGGDAADASFTLLSHYDSGIVFPVGDTDYEIYGDQDLYQFYLPNYTGDIQIDWTEENHSILDAVRVDTLVVAPEPASLGLIGIASLALGRRRHVSC